ncbi:MAG: alkaline phosphatase D family protein [Deltaproteobacteria bacterium]|nr:alkaline phosphatase D family protein [Deltaproteobacteria bacterium]
MNPYYGGGEAVPGVWTDFEVGDVHFILLDGRYYRTDPTGEHPTMLGPVQKQWLFETLAASTASFKILASPVPFAPGRKRIDGGRDTWDGYPDEREEIFSFIERNRIEGVFLISGDRHRSDAWKIERTEGYDLYEASTAHLTKPGTHPLKPEALFSHRGRPMYGVLGFDFTTADPELRYTVIDIDSERVDSLALRRSQLSFSPEPPEGTAPEKPQG